MHKRLLHIITTLLTTLLAIAVNSTTYAQEDDSIQFAKLIKQSESLIYTSPFDAIEYAGQAKQIAENNGDSVNIATACTTLGQCYYHTRIYYMAMDQMYKAFEINTLLDRQQPLAECMVDIANTYLQQEVHEMAKEYSIKALNICNKYDFPKTKADALTTLGRINTITDEDNAIQPLSEAKRIYDSLGLSNESAETNLYIATAYSKMDESDSAIMILNKNLKDYSFQNNREAIARTNFAFGLTYEELDEGTKAESYYKTALSQFDECNMRHDLLLALIKLARLQFNDEDYNAAIGNASKALHEAQMDEKNLGVEEIIIKHDACEMLYKSYQKRGDINLALQYCERYILIGDSVYSLKRKEQFSEFQVSMESQRLQKEIDMLQVNSEKERLLIERKQSNRNITLLAIIIALVIAVVIIYYYRYKEKARHNADLSLSNSRMEQEIKERKIAETELRNSEEKYRLLFRKTPVGIVQFNDKHIITAVNERFIQIFGLKNKSIIGQDIYTVIPQKQFDTIEANSDTGKDSISKSELKVNTPGGEVFASVSYKSYIDQTGTSIEKGGILIIEDITEQKIAEAQLAAYNSASDNIIEMMPESIFLLDSKANYIFARIPNISIKEQNTYLGKNMREMLTPDVLLPFLVAFNTVKKTGETQYAEYETEGSDPNHVTYNEAQFTRCEEDKVLVVVRDISRLKMAESKLRMAKRTAESGSKAKNEFILGISSELKEPIESILYNCEQITPEVKGKEASEKLKQALNSALFVNETFIDLLKLTEAEEGKQLNTKEVNPLIVAKGVFDIFKSRAEDKKIAYKFETKSGLPTSLVLDEIRLRQILFNIISNGIKYTDKGYVKLTIDAVANESTHNTNLVFTVEDTGIGLSESQIASLFNDTNAKKGMVLTKKMIDSIGATIEIKSEQGKGSAFIITIPDVLINKQSTENTSKLAHTGEAKTTSSRRKSSDAMREYISVLKDNLMPQYHKMEQQISFEALESFVAQLRQQSEHYKIEKGIELADELAINIRNYDIPNITRNIRKIETYIQTNIHDLQGE